MGRRKIKPGEDLGKGALTSASMAKPEFDMKRINPTAEGAYTKQGPGVGGSADITMYLDKLYGVKLDPVHRVLDIGFGHGQFILEAAGMGCKAVAGIEIAAAAMEHVRENDPEGKIEIHQLDVSHDLLPFPDDSFDIVACTETIEHLDSPYHMVSEVKRVLTHDGIFLLAFPMPEDNLGYSGGQHAHVYPGFLTQSSFERFMMQLYFRAPSRIPNGSSAWYAYRNYKGEGIVDVFEMIAGNYEEDDLYSVVKS